MLGDAGVGKTSLLAQYVDGMFRQEYIQTVGANFLIKEVNIRELINQVTIDDPKAKENFVQKGLTLYYWDIGGQHDKLFANEYFFYQAVAGVVVFNLIDKKTFDDINFWIDKMKEFSGDIPYILLGNKADLDHSKNIDKEVVKKKANELGVKYYETSAKTNENVNEAFTDLAIQILNNFK